MKTKISQRISRRQNWDTEKAIDTSRKHFFLNRINDRKITERQIKFVHHAIILVRTKGIIIISVNKFVIIDWTALHRKSGGLITPV